MRVKLPLQREKKGGTALFLRMRRSVAVTFAALSVAVIGAPLASAQPVDQDGLVNVNVGDVNILNDSPITVAAQVAAQVCGVDVGPLALAVLGQAVAVDRSGRTRTVCQSDQGPVTISNN